MRPAGDLSLAYRRADGGDPVRIPLRPEGEPQDRVLNVVPFLARHGLSLLTRMAEAIEVPLVDEEGDAAGVRP